MPNVHVIAGCNGAGKTTFARRFLPDYAGCVEFVNADLIAGGLSPFAPEGAAIQAGRLLVRRVNDLAVKGVDFAFETTLSGRAHERILSHLKQSGYIVHLFYLWLPDVELALRRVEDRVRNGGHHVPESVVRRRYRRGLENLFNVYTDSVDSLTILDNSGRRPWMVYRRSGKEERVLDRQTFARIVGKDSGPMTVREDGVDWSLSEKAEQALRAAVTQLIEERRDTGMPLIVWKDGKVVELDPEEAAKGKRGERGIGQND